jgi:hypothetical protein
MPIRLLKRVKITNDAAPEEKLQVKWLNKIRELGFKPV